MAGEFSPLIGHASNGDRRPRPGDPALWDDEIVSSGPIGFDDRAGATRVRTRQTA
jgi:hypothetical protein